MAPWNPRLPATMNWLAHLLLSPPDDPDFQLGNLLADFVKGNARHGTGEGFQRGMRCHQAIDAFTDSHPVAARSRTRLAARHGHFSGILVDVFYDHFLACHWRRFSPHQSLDAFVDGVHAAAAEPHRLAGLPEEARTAIARIVADDRLRSYREVSGIAAALGRLSLYLTTRLRRPVDLEPAADELVVQRRELEADFLEFFPLLHARIAGGKDDFATPSHPAY